jgi:hypothetical protein
MSGSSAAAVRYLICCFLLYLAPVASLQAAAPAAANQLAGHPSPYLALHGSDPVAWQEWNADTVARARRENKLLFVSVGYFACHWCHVMQRESYKNPAIAAQLNRDFIPVKVDRELHGGLDDALQTFSTQLNGISGWPLNAFVTPDGFHAPLSIECLRAGKHVLCEKPLALNHQDAKAMVAAAKRAGRCCFGLPYRVYCLRLRA